MSDRPSASRISRLAPRLALFAAVVLLLAGIAMAFSSERANTAQKIDGFRVEARILAATVTAALAFDDSKAAQEYVEALASDPDIEAAAIYAANGSLFVGYRRHDTTQLPKSAYPAAPHFAGDRLVIAEPVVQGGEKLLGTVYLATVIEPLAQRLERYALIGLLAVMAALVVAVLGAGQRALGRANAELTRRAGDLAAANLTLRRESEEREKAQEALRLAQRVEAVGQLTAGIAHDFNNLLTAVIGNLDRLAARHAGDERSQRLAAGALRAAERGAQLTAQLLAFSRRQRLAPKPVDLNRVVGNMEGMLRSTLGATIRIETRLAADLPLALADLAQIELMVLNLAINARDAMPEGGTLTIATEALHLGSPARPEEPPAGDYIAISVSDTGIGIVPEIRDRVFEPFFTTKEVGKGSGLGLPQILGVAQQLGGGVLLETRPGEGTTFRICLPRAPAAAPAGAASSVPAAADPPHEAGSAPPHLRILLVDDDEDVRAVTAAMLREDGHIVVEAASGAAALKLLADAGNAIDAMVADFAMPGMNGIELVGEARRRVPGMPAVLVTGYADRVAFADPGERSEVLQKPFRGADLAAKLARAVGRDPAA